MWIGGKNKKTVQVDIRTENLDTKVCFFFVRNISSKITSK